MDLTPQKMGSCKPYSFKVDDTCLGGTDRSVVWADCNTLKTAKTTGTTA